MIGFTVPPVTLAVAVLIVAVLTLSGFFRTLQFTCMSALTYADLDHARMSYGTSIASVCQQISMSLGVAVGATALHLFTGAQGGALGAASFVPTFIFIGLIPISAVAVFTRLPPGAGDEVSGRRSAITEAV